jgi:hypothetical protein
MTLTVCFALPGCYERSTDGGAQGTKSMPVGDPAIKYYKGPADGKKVTIHLQAGFTGEEVILHYNDVRLYDGVPKTKLTLGMAELVHFTVGPEPNGKIALQYKGQLTPHIFTWADGAHIAINVRDKVEWKQAKEP